MVRGLLSALLSLACCAGPAAAAVSAFDPGESAGAAIERFRASGDPGALDGAAARHPGNPAIAAERARALLEAGDLAGALALLEPLRRDHPGLAVARHLLGVARSKQGRPGAAVAELSAAAEDEAYEGRGECLVALGALRLRRLEFAAARGALRRAARLLPDDPRPWRYLALLEEGLTRTAEARLAYAECARRDPADRASREKAEGAAPIARGFSVTHRLAAAEALLLSRDLDEADRQAGLALDEAPTHEVALCLRGMIRLDAGRPTEAYALLAPLAGCPAELYPEVQFQTGRALAALGRRAEAEMAFRKALDVRPDLAPAWRALADLHEGDGRTAEAALALEASLAEEYEVPHVQARLAALRRASGVPCGADGLPAWRSFHYRGRAKLARGDFEGAAADYDEAWRRNSGDVELLRDLVMIHRALDLPHIARLHLERLERLAPTDPSTPAACGYLLRAEGRTAEAEIAFRTALARNPVETLALTGLARLALDRGDPSDARDGFARVLALGERNATVLAGYVEACDRLGRLAEAEAALRELLRLEPGHARAVEWLARLGRPSPRLPEGESPPR